MTPLSPVDKDPVAFLFPGQGAQRIGMGMDLEADFPAARTRFDQAEQELGIALRDLCAQGPEARLNQDLNAQLATYTISCIITDILTERGISPCFCAGYSSGFYAAAYAAGCFDFVSGLHLVRDAGETLLEEGKKIDGGMALIFGLSADHVSKLIGKDTQVQLAILNTPRQMVISGINAHLRKVMDRAIHEGALDTYRLPVETAYHSNFMENAGNRFLNALQGRAFKDPCIPLFSYTTLKPVADANALCVTMARQLSRPVFWVDLIKKLGHNGCSRMVEIGSGTLISRTVRWIDRRIDILHTDNGENVRQVIQALAG